METIQDGPAAPSIIAVEIGSTKLQVCAGTGEGHILGTCRIAVDRSRGAEGVREQITQGLSQLIPKWDPVAVGVGYGGPVNWHTGRIWRSYHLEGWSDFALGEWLSEQSGLPVYVDNDANVAALGEAIRGAGAGCDPVFYVTLGSGVGGGLVIQRKIYHGVSPGELEIGHLLVDEKGSIVEDHCSGWSIDRRIRKLIQEIPSSDLAVMVGKDAGGEAKYLSDALAKNDAGARQILQELAQSLALALSHVAHLLHPEIIVLGGGLSHLGEPLRASVQEEFVKRVMDAFQNTTRIAISQLQEKAVPTGALIIGRTKRCFFSAEPSLKLHRMNL